MKISTRLKMAALVPAVVALAIGLALMWSSRVSENVRRESLMALQVEGAVHELSDLVHYYLLHHEDRPWQQFQIVHAELMMQLSGVRFKDPEQTRLRDDLRSGIDKTAEIFHKLIVNGERDPAPGTAALVREAEERLAGQVLVRSRDALADVQRLERLISEKGAAVNRQTHWLIMSLAVMLAVLMTTILMTMMGGITGLLARLQRSVDLVGSGDLSHRTGITAGDEIGGLAQAFDAMTARLQSTTVSRDGLTVEVAARKLAEDHAHRQAQELQAQNWIKTGQTLLNECLHGQKDVASLANDIIASMVGHVGAEVGALFIARDGRLRLVGRYAYRAHADVPEEFQFGEGLVGQAAQDGKLRVLENAPENYLLVGSSLGQARPESIVVAPFRYAGETKGVIEIASLKKFSTLDRQFFECILDAIGVAVNTAQARARLQVLLEESQQQGEELQAQQEELRAANEELEEQTGQLRVSEARLQAQQEELKVTNAALGEKNELLEQQKKEVEKARKDIAAKAEEVALASKYKSEFLANMSHELRTPLNSLLLLAQALMQNRDGNLTKQQIESVEIIYGSGSDLLTLINEVLDLSRIEAGRLNVQVGNVRTSDLADSVRASFGHMAQQKGLALDIVVHEDAPAQILSDRNRIEQIVRNLVSNAIKFTEKGSVAVAFGRPCSGSDLSRCGLSANECLSMSIKDTGIGIAAEHQSIIFEAFQQADSGTARKYGGTGLGLSISRELAHLLGGSIHVESEPGKGSTFTLHLPLAIPLGKKSASSDAVAHRILRAPDTSGPNDTAQRKSAPLQIEDDREGLEENDRIVLVIEDDASFARLLLRKCHERGFKCLAAPSGELGLELAAKHLPCAVILDIRLPGIDGWTVLSSLKENTRTRHIPVHVVSVEERSSEALRKGAIGHAVKPLDQERVDEIFRRLEQVSTLKPKRVLVVEDDPALRRETANLIGNGDVTVDEVGTGSEALEAIKAGGYDCMVLDLKLPDMDGIELLATLSREGIELPPVIVHTARALTSGEEIALREHAESIVIKDVRSQERLLDEVSLFLHRIVSKMSDTKRKIIMDLHETDAILKDKKVLIVDDDMRTTFALSHLLTDRGMKTLKAEHGERALQLLHEHTDVDLVLMDIMMPAMDGYESMKRIRAQERFRKLPIIVLTAKAMPEDRERCLEAGANDYLPKPVDQQRLLSMLRVWLHR